MKDGTVKVARWTAGFEVRRSWQCSLHWQQQQHSPLLPHGWQGSDDEDELGWQALLLDQPEQEEEEEEEEEEDQPLSKKQK
jgi:hypothetical protein